MYLSRGLGTIASDIQAAAIAKGVDPSLALAVARHESGLNPNAQSQTSSAAGLFQLVNATQQTFGVTNPYDPTQNMNAGISFLSQLQAKYGDTSTALLAYAWGPGNVDKWLASGADPSKVLPESAKFVSDLGYSLPGGSGAGGTYEVAPSFDLASMLPDFSSLDWSSWVPWAGVGLGVLGLVLVLQRR